MPATAVFSYGRLNPPTVGHAKLVDRLVNYGKAEHTKPVLFLSYTQHKRTDPLSPHDKLYFAKAVWDDLGTVDIRLAPGAGTIFDAMEWLDAKGYDRVVMVVGSDRVNEFRDLLRKYNNQAYHFKSIAVESAGMRDPDAEGLTGISASKMRAWAAAGDKENFFSGCPPSMSKALMIKMYHAVRAGMDLQTKKRLGENMKKEENTNFIGTDAIRKKYAKDTPGQSDDIQVTEFSEDRLDDLERFGRCKCPDRDINPDAALDDVSLNLFNRIKRALQGHRV